MPTRRMTNRRSGNKSNNRDASGSGLGGPKSRKKGASSGWRLIGFLGTLGLIGAVAVVVSKNKRNSSLQSIMAGAAVVTNGNGDGRSGSGSTSSSSSSPRRSAKATDRRDPMADYPDWSQAFAKYDKCVVKWTPPRAKEKWDTKPLWLPSFPGSGSTSPAGSGDIMKPLINAITGLRGGAKFYHASSKILRRCKGNDETATCSNGHPGVDIGPEKQKSKFHQKVIFVIRNFKNCFPIMHNDKAIAYHGAKGQIPIDDWRQARDQWYSNVFEGWRKIITTWKAMEEYDIGLYVQYEELMDPERGPDVTQRIANLLESAGFTVAPNDDLPCIWFQSVKDEYLRLKEFRKYNFGYTQEQQDTIAKELEKLQKEVSEDKPLVKILSEYIEDTKTKTLTDGPSPEGKKASS